MPWYLYLAFKDFFPSGKRWGSPFFLLSVLGVALGVMVLVIVQSVMGGFGQVHRERIVDLGGHLDIRSGGYPFSDYEEVAKSIAARPEVERVAPFAQGFLMVQRGGVPAFPFALGLSMNEEPVLSVREYMQEGSFDDLYDDTVLVSRRLANQLRLGIGSTLEVYTPLMLQRLKADEVILPREFEVVGVYEVDWNREFTPGILFSLRSMQDLYGLGNSVHALGIRMLDTESEDELAASLRESLPPFLGVQTWKERWADFLWVLDLEKTMMLFLNLFIVAVAVFAIAIAQLLTVLRKTREIGLFSVIGAKRKELLYLYCIQGAMIGCLGLILGIFLALTFLAFRDPIILFISDLTGTRETLIRYYYFANLPVHMAARDFIVISFSAVSLSVAASLIPAWRAARLKPAEALRVDL